MSELKTQNITETDIAFGKIANGLQSAASDHILGIAKDIYDTKQQAYQEDINEYLLNKVDEYLGDNTEDEEETFLDAVLERDIYAELTVGGILEGTTLTKGMTFTTFVERLLTLINVGSIKSPTGEGTVSIEAPTIIVEKEEENGSWVEIKSGTTVKENTKVRVRITNIPESTFEKIFAGIKKGGNNPGDVLAYGWLKSVDGGDAVFGEGNCEISTNTDIIGKDHLTISIANGDFNGLEIDDDGKINNVEFNIRSSSSTSEIKVGEIKVQSNSAKYQLKSAYDYEIAAASNKQDSKPEQLENISTDRKITINKDANIGSEKSSSNYSTFILNVEGWGLVPNELKTPGSLSINPPTIKVINNTEGGKEVNSGDPLDPNHEITVSVKLNGNSSVSGASAYLQKSSSTFQYGWEKLKNGVRNEIVDREQINKEPNKHCKIGTTWSKPTEDILEFLGTPTGVFKNMQISNNKEIKFTTEVGEIASEFKVRAKSGEHTLLSDAKYDIYALSSIQSSGKSAQMNNTYSITNGQQLKTFGSRYSSESSFKFNIKDNPFGIIPTIAIYGAVSIGAPTITVTKTDGKPVSKNQELDPREKINVNVTIPKSQVTTNFSAVYKYSSNGLQYGWKLDKDGVITTGGTGTNCEIGLTVNSENDTLNIKSADGVFKNRTFSGNTINWSNITASEASTLEVEAIAGTRTIYPDANYVLYALSELGHTKDSSTTKTELNKNTSLKTISGIKSSNIFNFRLLKELWITMPNIVRTGGVVSFSNPTITVKKSSDKSVVKSGTTLDPSDKLDIVITLPKSSISEASYSVDVSNLTYGWKLLQNKVETTGKPTDKCNIELTIDKTNAADKHTVTGTGAFSGLSTTTLTKNGVSVGESGKNYSLTITSTHGTYKIMPKYSDCKIYSLSSFGNTNDSYSAIPPSKIINGTTKTATFEYFVKAAQKELFYKIVPSTEVTTILRNASSYTSLTENNLINDLGFTKYIQDNADKIAQISGGMCLIFTKLPFENIAVLNDGNVEMALKDNNRNIGGYNFYSFNIKGDSIYKLKIK